MVLEECSGSGGDHWRSEVAHTESFNINPKEEAGVICILAALLIGYLH